MILQCCIVLKVHLVMLAQNRGQDILFHFVNVLLHGNHSSKQVLLSPLKTEYTALRQSARGITQIRNICEEALSSLQIGPKHGGLRTVSIAFEDNRGTLSLVIYHRLTSWTKYYTPTLPIRLTPIKI